MDGLFTGSAGDRRRFLDRLVLSVDPAHGSRALSYERAMRSRNRLCPKAAPTRPGWTGLRRK
jgi:DNA replication and repair protein RecF